MNPHVAIVSFKLLYECNKYKNNAKYKPNPINPYKYPPTNPITHIFIILYKSNRSPKFNLFISYEIFIGYI